MLHADKKDEVDNTSIQYDIMAKKWELIFDLLGGEEVMQAKGQKWLPREEKESDKAYTNRLNRSSLFNGFEDTTEKLTAKPFSKVIQLAGDLPERLRVIENDIDNTGKDLTQFARGCFKTGVELGHTHILVDFPRIPEDATKADEKELNARPIFIEVKPQNLIAWTMDGNNQLNSIRMLEFRYEQVGNYGEKLVELIRVYTKTTWEIFKKVKKKDSEDFEWILDSFGNHTFGAVPLVTFYVNPIGTLTSRPPLESLARMNLAHWQSWSDQKNILHYARMAFLFGTGFSEDEIVEGIILSVNKAKLTTNENAKLSYVEHSGAAIGAGRIDLKDLEARMEVLGLQPMIQTTGNVTATERAIDESKTQSAIQSWITSLENALVAAYELAATWTKSEIPEDFSVDIFNDFSVLAKAGEDMDLLLKAQAQGVVSKITTIGEFKRRNVLSENIDPEKEILRIEDQGPDLGNMSAHEDEGEEEDADN